MLNAFILRCSFVKTYNFSLTIFIILAGGFKIILYRKVRNDYVPLLKEADVTDIFINNITIVYEYCNTGTPFGQANVIEKVKGLGAGKYKFVDL